LVALIASTKRKNRKLNPLEVVEKIEIAKKGIGSLPKVAQRIGLSYEMLRQIFSVKNCSEEVRRLTREGKLGSYDILYRLSKLPPSSQVAVARRVIAGEFTSEDVRAIVSFQRDFPRKSIESVIERIKGSRNIKQYVVYFELDPKRTNLSVLRLRFEKIFGKENVVSLNVDNGTGELILNVKGKNRLQEEAKNKGVTKREFIQNFVEEK
jgi:hypothetical protein